MEKDSKGVFRAFGEDFFVEWMKRRRDDKKGLRGFWEKQDDGKQRQTPTH